MDHRLVNGELMCEEGGITARCTCGWVSGGHFSSAAASVAMMDHKDKEASQYAADRERAYDLDHGGRS
jgi:hypothetical protein